MRAVRLYLRARTVIKFSCEQRACTRHIYRKARLCLQGASTLQNTDGEQRALRSTNLSFIKRKRYFAPSDLADTSKTGQQAQSRFKQPQQLTAKYALFDTKLRHVVHVSFSGYTAWTLKEISNPT